MDALQSLTNDILCCISHFIKEHRFDLFLDSFVLLVDKIFFFLIRFWQNMIIFIAGITGGAISKPGLGWGMCVLCNSGVNCKPLDQYYCIHLCHLYFGKFSMSSGLSLSLSLPPLSLLRTLSATFLSSIPKSLYTGGRGRYNVFLGCDHWHGQQHSFDSVCWTGSGLLSSHWPHLHDSVWQ